jgi:hypothetical protein
MKYKTFQEYFTHIFHNLKDISSLPLFERLLNFDLALRGIRFTQSSEIWLSD